jgi:hypothetical protein
MTILTKLQQMAIITITTANLQEQSDSAAIFIEPTIGIHFGNCLGNWYCYLFLVVLVIILLVASYYCHSCCYIIIVAIVVIVGCCRLCYLYIIVVVPV